MRQHLPRDSPPGASLNYITDSSEICDCGGSRTQSHSPAHRTPRGNSARRAASPSSRLLLPSGRSGGCRSTAQTVSANRHREGSEDTPAPWEMPPQLCTALNWDPKPLQGWLYALRE